MLKSNCIKSECGAFNALDHETEEAKITDQCLYSENVRMLVLIWVVPALVTVFCKSTDRKFGV